MENFRLHNRWFAKLGFLLLAVVVWSGFSGPTAAEEFSGDDVMLQKLFEFHSKLANQGNLESVVKLGAMYERGEGVAQDRKRAIELYRYAADRGSEAAMEMLANIESNRSNSTGDNGLKIKVPERKSVSKRDDAAIQKQKELESKLQREKAAAEAARIELENMRRAQQEEQEQQQKLQAELARIQQVQEQLARERAKAEAARREMELLRKKQEAELQKQKELALKQQEQTAKAQQKKEEAEQKKFSSNPCNTPAAKFMSTCN
jgi:hypothetical protein